MKRNYQQDLELNVENQQVHLQVEEILKTDVAKKRKPRIGQGVEESRNICFHNTKKLLQNYRAAMVCISQSMDDLADDCLDELGMKFSSMEELAAAMELDLSSIRIESRIRSMQRNRRMLSLINRAIDSLHKYGENGEEYYWLLYYKYLCPNQEKCRNDSEIEAKLNEKGFSITSSTFYRKHTQAIQDLGKILWGYTSREILAITDSLLPDEA